jgi:hypothetical protein
MSQRGTSLLDAIAATSVALTLGAATTDLVAGARTLAVIAMRERALTAARNRLELAIATPCAPAAFCGEGLDCGLTTESLHTLAAGLERATVRVTFDADGNAVRLATVRRAGCG